MTKTTDTSAISLLSCDEGFDPIEDRLRANIRGTIEAVFNEEPGSFLGRLRYGRKAGAVKGYRHGHRDRRITGTFGTETISVPRARVVYPQVWKFARGRGHEPLPGRAPAGAAHSGIPWNCKPTMETSKWTKATIRPWRRSWNS